MIRTLQDLTLHEVTQDEIGGCLFTTCGIVFARAAARNGYPERGAVFRGRAGRLVRNVRDRESHVMSMKEAGKMQDRIAAERWIRSTEDAEELADKQAAHDAALEWVASGYFDPGVSFEAGWAAKRNLHSPLCQCGETLPGPCVSRYPFGHNSRKCEPYVMPRMYDASDGEEQTL